MKAPYIFYQILTAFTNISEATYDIWKGLKLQVFSGVRAAFMCMFCRSLFVLLSFFFWPLRCLSFFDFRGLITLLVSSNSWYYHATWKYNVILCIHFKSVLIIFKSRFNSSFPSVVCRRAHVIFTLFVFACV